MTPRPRHAALAALLLAAACGGSSSYGGSKAASSPAAQQQINNGGTVDATGRTTVDVTAKNFEFSPSTIVAAPGTMLKLVVHNASQTKHNVTQSAQHVDADLDPGATQTVTMTVPASGRLVFFCEYHKSGGMAGQVGSAGSLGTTSSPGSEPSSGGYNPYGG